MIRALALLLTCQLAGEILTRALGLAVPGPVIGLALLAVLAVVHARIAGAEISAIEKTNLGVTASALLGSLGLLFVPAGVGIVQQLPLIGAYALPIFVALLVSTVLTLIVTVYVFVFVKRAITRDAPPADGGLMTNPFSIWVYLSATPLLWLAVTLVAWIAADAIARACGRHPLVNPVLIAIAMVGGVLVATGTPYQTYFEGAQFVHFLLGPATVAIAVPMVRHLTLVRANIVPMIVALLAGAVTAVVSVVAVAAAFGVPREILVSLAPKSVTAGIAMAITESMGGRPALTAVLVIATGVMGAVIVTPLMNALKITDYAARGFAVGLTSHGIGTARAFAVDEIAGTFAGIAMGLNGVATSLVVPLLLRWL